MSKRIFCIALEGNSGVIDEDVETSIVFDQKVSKLLDRFAIVDVQLMKLRVKTSLLHLEKHISSQELLKNTCHANNNKFMLRRQYLYKRPVQLKRSQKFGTYIHKEQFNLQMASRKISSWINISQTSNINPLITFKFLRMFASQNNFKKHCPFFNVSQCHVMAQSAIERKQISVLVFYINF